MHLITQQADFGNVAFLFLKVVLHLKIVLSPLPSASGLFSAYFLYNWACSCCHPWECTQEPARESVEVWVWHSGNWASWGNTWVKFFPASLDRHLAGVQNTQSARSVRSLMPADILICLIPSVINSLGILDAVGERSPTHLGKPGTHSLTHGKDPRLLHVSLSCASLGEGQCLQSLLPTLIHPNLFLFVCFTAVKCWKLPSRNLSSYKGSLSVGIYPS